MGRRLTSLIGSTAGPQGISRALGWAAAPAILSLAIVSGEPLSVEFLPGTAEPIAGRCMAAEDPHSETIPPDQLILRAVMLLDQRECRAARQILRMVRDEVPRTDAEVEKLLELTFSEDENFLPPVATLGIQELSSIRHLGGGSTITLQFTQGDTPAAAFKPDQSRGQSNYRAEIASWRLCELIECSFKIPYNRPIRVSRECFDSLYSRHSCPKQRAYAGNFRDLIWRQSNGVDYLHGTAKEWVPDFTTFPLELTSVWMPWLQQETDPSQLEVPLRTALAAWRDHPGTAKHYQRVLSKAGNLTTRQLSRQISDLLVFDFLVGNWDRMSTVQEWWGVNCQFTNQKLVSIDNGAAFNTYGNRKPQIQYEKVERYSRTLIRELRLLSKSTTLAWLFPEASSLEERAFEQFWRQRNAVLKRVDELIERYGEGAVLAFD